jgi:hypothetical protein
MIISDEQVARAIAYLQNPAQSAEVAGEGVPVSTELVLRVTEVVESMPDVRNSRVAEARERCEAHLPTSGEIADKLIGRVVSDAIR